MVRALLVPLVIPAVTTALSRHSCSHSTAGTAAALHLHHSWHSCSPTNPFFFSFLCCSSSSFPCRFTPWGWRQERGVHLCFLLSIPTGWACPWSSSCAHSVTSPVGAWALPPLQVIKHLQHPLSSLSHGGGWLLWVFGKGFHSSSDCLQGAFRGSSCGKTCTWCSGSLHVIGDTVQMGIWGQ